MSSSWDVLPGHALPALGGGVSVGVAPTQLIAAFGIGGYPGGAGRNVEAKFINDDPANTVTVTFYQSLDAGRPNMNPLQLVIGPQQSDRLRLESTADSFFWASATSSAGTSLVRTAVFVSAA